MKICAITNLCGSRVRSAGASAYGLVDEIGRAAGELAQARRVARDNRYSSLACLRTVGPFGVPKIRALFEATYFVGLRTAGVAKE